MSMALDVKTKVMYFSRAKKLHHFYSLFKEGNSVLDVGVSGEVQLKKTLPTVNYFLKEYQFNSESYTGLGVQDLTGMEDLYPGKRFVQYPGGKFPFSDKEFDWVFSNAVIEHVGDDNAKRLFINEMVRVAKNVFFTTPNKYFPVESHTNVFFIHWNDRLFYSWCQKYRPRRNKNNLHLLSFHRLQALLEDSSASSFSIYKNHLFGLPMHFTVVCSDNSNSEL